MQWINRFWTEEDGAETAEWVLFFALLALVAIAATGALNPALSNAFGTLGSDVNSHAADIY